MRNVWLPKSSAALFGRESLELVGLLLSEKGLVIVVIVVLEFVVMVVIRVMLMFA